jgi:hypothetical protein
MYEFKNPYIEIQKEINEANQIICDKEIEALH